MKNKQITRKITQGMYVLTTKDGGCIVDAVSQISAGENPLIAVSVMKQNYTNERLKKNEKFALSVIGENTDSEVISVFGLRSMRDVNKFEQIEMMEVEGVPVVKNSLGYMVCKIVENYENETHTLFIGKLEEADVLEEGVPMSYAYYQDHKESLIKVKVGANQTVWVCTVCGYIYEGDDLPEDFRCPKCGVDKSFFQKK